MVKIGVLTFHRCINYGSYWQAKCLADGLRSLGHRAVILDHASRKVDIAEWRCALRPTLPQPTLREDHGRYRRKIRRFFEAFEELPLSPRFPLDEPGRMPACDTVVVGSDEVWNLSHPWYGAFPAFYGEGLRARHLVSYAASFGHYDARLGLDQERAQSLRRFRHIAVRDAASRDLVENATGHRPELVLDPCLAFPPAPSVPVPLDEPYVAVYGHNFSPRFADAVARWARRRGLRTVSIGYRNAWADRQWIEAGPREFAALVAGARSVATNFFHGCVFALRYGRPFVCEGSSYRSTKLRSLMADAGTGAHFAGPSTPDSTFERLLEEPLPDAVQDRIDALRARSHRYLLAALLPATAAA
ncbi:MAG: polysaccharide pyruvyl transferase family protein [Gammaproteobacteria bacterium]